MGEKPKSGKTIAQEAFLDRMRTLGRQNLPDNTVLVSGKDLLGATTLFGIKIREDIQEALIEALTEHDVSIRIEAAELAALNKPRLKAWIYDWTMNIGVGIMILRDPSLRDKTEIKLKEDDDGIPF